ncbi:52 kDa repressor of the inhibitor of the protein kinase-like [Xenia sp. Carnegie-2017]|uniref:52 kDa repressor of the inhibitor of the protein kinase-like n=1 Tax=Xenia sp. Carnegie-2017 TaxID=2897299 RepID=UPI001F03BA54|nr:52 kDa repressor of the inhibitor of the protein kinase-like [Xenia sp. Carnegie-2017]
MSLVLRFVDEEFNIREEFFRFIHCSEDMSGKDLASVILKCLNEELNLNIQDCRGQGYDGTGAVAGCINGLAARIKNLNEKAIYTHCFSHRLNLIIFGTCAVQYVRNVLEHVKEVANFFNSSQCRQLILAKCIGERCPDSEKKRLKSACKTRGVERITSLDTFEELYVAIVFSLEEMSFNVEVTQLLQSSSNDIADGFNLIEALKKLSRTVRNEVDVYHANWYSIALTMAEKKTITILLADYLCSELEKRKIYSFSSLFLDDLPNPKALDSELDLWQKYWESSSTTCLPENVSSTLKSVNFPGFENIKVLLKILGTIPVTSCECERSFSALRRLKNYTRSTMAADRLNGLALLYIHQDINPDKEKIIDLFAKDKRRIELAF